MLWGRFGYGVDSQREEVGKELGKELVSVPRRIAGLHRLPKTETETRQKTAKQAPSEKQPPRSQA